MHELKKAVRERYSRGSQEREVGLCCPVQYDAKLLEALPPEVLERDYGCGDPSRYVRSGERVLDLGSGTGKICFITAQLIGPQGQVVGLDENLDMLSLARKAQRTVASRLGFDNVVFIEGAIENLTGLIPTDSFDVVLSNCVLNLLLPEHKKALFSQIFRIIRPGGRAAISDIVSSEDVPAALRQDSELWSGCISGALREDRFISGFVDAGFDRVSVASRTDQPWQTLSGIDFHSITVLAEKGPASAGCC